MRKRKRAANTLKAAKKQANSVAENNDMSDKQKIKVGAAHSFICSTALVLCEVMVYYAICRRLPRR